MRNVFWTIRTFLHWQTVLFLSKLAHFFAIKMGDIIEEGMMRLKISEYDEIELIYAKLQLEELTREPLYLKYKTWP